MGSRPEDKGKVGRRGQKRQAPKGIRKKTVRVTAQKKAEPLLLGETRGKCDHLDAMDYLKKG